VGGGELAKDDISLHRHSCWCTHLPLTPHHTPLPFTQTPHSLEPSTPHTRRPLQEIKAKTNALQQAVMKIGESLAGKSSEGGSENVQDAEVKDKDKQ